MVMEMAVEPAPQLAAQHDFSAFIGESEAMLSVYNTITRLLDNDSTVLILGESGTGKELVAKAIHLNSIRRNQPLITVNCGAIPEELLESELFGHEKGSFTGAIRTRIGKFEMADKGTIFLDEIGDMSPSLQVKLLRILQERTFDRVGGTKTQSVDVRVIAATNRNLEQAITGGTFREDLYYRLNVIPLELPPLRDRGNDISLLAGYFIKRFNRMKGRNILGITPEALKSLKSYTWPGNVRELEHMVERMVVLKGEGYIGRDDLPPKIRDVELKDDFQLLRDMLLVGEPEELVDMGVVTKDQVPAKLAASNGIAVEESASGKPLGEIIPINGNGHGHTNGRGAAALNGGGLAKVAPASAEKPTVVNDEANVVMASGYDAVGQGVTENPYAPILPPEGINLKEAVDKYETALIVAALERCNWVKNKAATLLGLNRTTLVEKLKKKGMLYGIQEEKESA